MSFFYGPRYWPNSTSCYNIQVAILRSKCFSRQTDSQGTPVLPDFVQLTLYPVFRVKGIAYFRLCQIKHQACLICFYGKKYRSNSTSNLTAISVLEMLYPINECQGTPVFLDFALFTICNGFLRLRVITQSALYVLVDQVGH